MKREELYNKLRIVAIVLMTISILLGAFFAYKNSSKKDNNDAIKFSKEYKGVKEDNMFRYLSLKDSVKKIEKEKGVFFFCTKEKLNCDKYALYLYEEAKDLGYTPIYYIDIKDALEEDLNNLKSLTNCSDFPLIVVTDSKKIDNINTIYDKWDDTEVEAFKIEIMNEINRLSDAACQEDC